MLVVFPMVTKAIGDLIAPSHVSSVAAFIVLKLIRCFRLRKYMNSNGNEVKNAKVHPSFLKVPNCIFINHIV